MISPKVRTSNVVAPVAIAEPASPKSLRQRTVAREEQLKFTTLLQIRIVVRALSKFSITYKTFFAPLSPSSADFYVRILLTKENAVSTAEKKADSPINISIIIPVIISDCKDCSLQNMLIQIYYYNSFTTLLFLRKKSKKIEI